MDSGKSEKYLAIDFGLKRLGIAITDNLKLFAFTRNSIANNEEACTIIIDIIRKEDVSKVIIGMPYNLKNERTDATEPTIRFSAKLKSLIDENNLNVQIIFFDERLTSSLASHYVSQSGIPKKKRQSKGLIDSVSAQILLEDYLRKEKNKQ